MKKKKKYLLLLGLSTLFFALPGLSALSLAADNEECMQCHGDDSLSRIESEGIKEAIYVDPSSFNYSTHNVNGVGCTDCHQDAAELNWDNELPHSTTLAPVDCDMCHDGEAEAYLNSVHKKAGGKGITIPCYACHDYHYTARLEANSVFQRENAFCLKCHNPQNFHDWLPQKDTHFTFVECTVCHSPESPRRINLRFFDLIRNRFLEGDEIMKALQTNYTGFLKKMDTDKDGVISVDEFGDMVLMLRQKDIRGTFHAELVVELQPLVHHVNRGIAHRECGLCHEPNSPFFAEVSFCLLKEDGSLVHNPVERAVLETYDVNHFYALGGTRVRLLDKIGAILLAGGAGVIAAHLTARIVTMPVRRKRKEEK